MSIDRTALRRVGLVLVAVGVVFVVLWMGRVIRAGRSLLAYMDQARSMADRGVGQIDPVVLGEIVKGVREDVVVLKRQVGWLAPFGSAFRWMPSIGPLLDQAPALLALADGGTEMVVLFWADLAPAVSDGSSLSPSLIRASLPRLSSNLQAKHQAAERVSRAYEEINCAAFPETYQGPCERVDSWVSLLPAVVRRLDALPELAGFNDPQVYLLLALNEDELRPGGGFISGVGEIWIENGEIVSLEFRDSYSVDDFSQPYPQPPWPLERFMGLGLWVFRDSNWSPDFPTAVDDGLPLYRTGLQEDIDGVVAADQKAVQALVGAIGPLSVPNAERPVDADTVIDYMHNAWAPEDEKITREWWNQRKAFMGDLATAMMDKLKRGDVDWLALAETGLGLIEGKDLQIITTDSAFREFLAEQQWDGGLHYDGGGDYLMVAEANLGYNKASRKIDRTLRYEVDLTVDPVQVALHLAYAHTSEVDKDCVPEVRYDLDYVEMMDRCYWAFIRAFVPSNSELLQASEHPVAADSLITGRAWPGQVAITETTASSGGQFAVFSQAFLLPTASEETVRFVYQQPEGLIERDETGTSLYRLTVQKQAGVSSFPVQVILRTPENAIVSHMQPETCTRDEVDYVLCEMDLDRDRVIEFRYRLSEERQP